MATKKPRLNLTLEPQRYELLKRLAEQQGTSMSAIVVELLDTVAPVLERVCVAVENARKAQESVKLNLVKTAEEAEASLAPMLAEAMGQLDMFLGACNEAGEGAAEAENPRPVITGVRSPHPPSLTTPQKPKKSRRGHAI